MQGTQLTERHATLAEVVRATSLLTKSERLRLASKARLLIWGTEYADPLELLNEAVKRALVAASSAKHAGERGRPWPIQRVEFAAFLSRCMESIADASRESPAQTRTSELEALAGDTGDVDSVIHGAGLWNSDAMSQALSAEEDAQQQEKARSDVAIIEHHFRDDQDVLAIIEGEKSDMAVKVVIELFAMDQKTYDSARRRLRRQVDKLMPGRRQ